MMIGLMSLIGVNYGEASDATTTSSSNSLRTKDSGKNSQKNEEIITAESSSNSLTTTRSSSDDSIEVDEKENTAIVLLPDSFAEDPFDIDEEKINEFVKKVILHYWKPNEKKLENPEEIYKDWQSLINELKEEDKIQRIIAYINDKAFYPYSLMEDAKLKEDEVVSFLNELEQLVLAMGEKKDLNESKQLVQTIDTNNKSEPKKRKFSKNSAVKKYNKQPKIESLNNLETIETES